MGRTHLMFAYDAGERVVTRTDSHKHVHENGKVYERHNLSFGRDAAPDALYNAPVVTWPIINVEFATVEQIDAMLAALAELREKATA